MVENNVVFVVGLPGCGKSVTCYDILASFIEKDREKNFVHIVNDLTKLDMSNIRSNMIILFDDCFENWFYLRNKKATDEMILKDVLEKVQECVNACLLFTLRKCTKEYFDSTLKDAVRSRVPCILDFEGKDCLLSEEDAYSILCTFIKYHDPAYYRKGDDRKSLTDDEEMMSKIVEKLVAPPKHPDREFRTIGKTEALEIMCMKFDSLHKIEGFFGNPIEYLKKEFQRMKNSSLLSEKWEFCSFIYVLLKGGCVSNSVPDFLLLSKITHKFDIDLQNGNFSSVCGSLLYERAGQIMVQHPCVVVALLSFVVFSGNRKFIDFFIADCDINILLRYFRFSESSGKGEKDVICLTTAGVFNNDDWVPQIAGRFAKVYVSTRDDNIVNHINMKGERFKKIFIRKCKLAENFT